MLCGLDDRYHNDDDNDSYCDPDDDAHLRVHTRIREVIDKVEEDETYLHVLPPGIPKGWIIIDVEYDKSEGKTHHMFCEGTEMRLAKGT